MENKLHSLDQLLCESMKIAQEIIYESHPTGTEALQWDAEYQSKMSYAYNFIKNISILGCKS